MKTTKSFKNIILMVLYSATSGVYINLIGRLIFSELIALAVFPFTNFSFLFKKFRSLKYITKCFLLLFFAQIISDVINQSQSIDYMRGLSVIIFSFVSLIFILNQIHKNSRNIILYFIFIFFVKLIFGETGLEEELDLSIIKESRNFFKIRFVGFLNIGLMIISFFLFRINKKKTVPILFFSYGLLCLVLDARSNGLIFLISSSIIFIKNMNIKISRARLVMTMLILAPIFYSGYVYYVNKVLNNEIVGFNSSSQISQMSNPYNPFELLYYGRIETVVAASAISKKPFFGHGSWALDRDGKYVRLAEQLANKKYSGQKRFIPSHSLLLGAWLYAGLLGFIAIFLIFRKLFIIYYQILKYKRIYHLFPILTVLTIDMVWGVIYSPYGILRITFPVFAALLIYFDNLNSLSIKE